MKYCAHCGAEINDEAVVCVKCGCSTTKTDLPVVNKVNTLDVPSAGWAVLSFFFTWLGAIMFLVWRKSSPQKANSCAQGLAIATIVSAVFSTIVSIVWFFVFATYFDDIFSYFL
ncbi:MAG: zinc ribbon domain-containing protein [Treponema sp.]|nr:zinc ribbon domain-containing protein [Treponema sp.]